jgi:uncharacterized protein
LKRFTPIYPFAVFFLFIILNFFGVKQVLKIQTHSSIEQFQPKDHALLKTDKTIRNRFHMDKALPLIVLLKAPSGGGATANWLTPRYLKELGSLSAKIKEHPEVSSIYSLANIETAVTSADSFRVAPIKELVSTPKEIKAVFDNPLIAPHFVSKDGKYAAMAIKTKSLSFKQQSDFIKKVEKIISKKPKMYTAQVGGPTAISAQMTALLGEEISLFTGLSLIISVLVLLAIFRNRSTALASLIIVASANIFALAFMSFFHLPLTPLSCTLPILVTLTVVAILSQTLTRMGEFPFEEKRSVLIFKVLKDLTGSHLLATLTTSIGFATLINSDIPLIKEYGLAVTVCVMIAAIVTLVLYSALYMWLPIPVKRVWPLSSSTVASWIVQNRKPFFYTIISCTLVFGALGSKLNWSTLLFEDLPKSHPARQATQMAETHLGGAIPLEFSIGSDNQKAPWKSPANLRKIARLTEKWRKEAHVGSVIALSDFLKVTNSQRQIASESNAISAALFVYSMSNKNPVEGFLSPNEKFTRIALRLKDVPSLKIKSLIEKMKLEAQTAFPNMKVEIGGMAATLHPIQLTLARELMFGFYEAMLLIFILLVFVFRSPRWALVSIIPNLVPPALLLGMLAITQTPIKPGIAIIFSVSLGFAFNNTVYILMKLKALKEKHSLWSIKEVQTAVFREELGPCFISSLAVMSGFAVFLFSNFEMNIMFGTFMLVSVASGLLGDLVLLPALLSLFPRLLHTEKRDENISTPTPDDQNDVRPAQEGIFDMLPDTKIAVHLVLAISLLFGASSAKGALPSVDELLKKAQASNRAPNEQIQLLMKNKASDGSTKERTILIKRKSGKEQKAMVKLLAPADLKGIGLLTIIEKNKEESQFLFLPTEKRSRRIVGSNKKGRFLDSELSFEDMNIATYQNFTNVIRESGKDKSKIVIESKVKNKDESSYSKINTWLDAKTHRLAKAEYYDDDGKLLKIISFEKYKKYGKIWRPQLINVKNVQEKRSTSLELKKVSLKKLDDSEFAMSALEEN